MWGIRTPKFFKTAILVKAEDYEIQDLVLIHMLHITFFLSFFSALFNPLLGLPLSVIYGNLLSLVFLLFIYWITRFKKKFVIGRRLYLGFVIIMINFLWLETEGSAGPSLLCILAFLPLFVFIVENKVLKYGFWVVGINVPALILIELYYPELITPYQSSLQRILDILLVCIVFVIFEIPLIIYVKNTVISERNKAKRAELAKTSYITNLSHEIRTPMNAILGFSELLNQDDLQNSERKSYIKIINDNGQTLLNLLNNIINISKIEEAQANVSPLEVSPLETLQRVHSALSYKANNTDVTFKVIQQSTSNRLIYTDSIMLYQIITNLVFNALKFTSKGYVSLSYNMVGDSISFLIEDTGTGISKEQQESIFNPFQQDKVNGQLNYNGSGLGLTISKSLATMLQGELSFKSELNVGSTFCLRLPIRYKE